MNLIKKVKISALLGLFTLAAAVTLPAQAEVNPFETQTITTIVSASAGDDKCGEGKAKGKCGEGKAKAKGKCGEGKCGEGKKKSSKCGEGKKKSSKCGEGKAKSSKCGE